MDNGPQPEENLLSPCEPQMKDKGPLLEENLLPLCEPQMKDNGPLPGENSLPPCEPQMKEVSISGYVLISCEKQLSHKVLVKWISNSLIGSTLL